MKAVMGSTVVHYQHNTVAVREAVADVNLGTGLQL